MTALKIQTAILFDSICKGLYMFISPHIINIGGNHSVIGIFTVALSICILLSEDLLKSFKDVYGRRYTLLIFLVLAFFTHIICAITSSCWLLIVARCLYTLVNHAQQFYERMLLDVTPKEETGYYLTTYTILNYCGYIIGPIVAGCLFEVGFAYSCLLAAILTAFSIGVVPVASDEPQQQDNARFSERVVKRLSNSLEKFTKADIEHNWDIISAKFLYYVSMSVFFMRYTQILGYNFSASPATVGLIIAYTNILVFAALYCAAAWKPSTYFSDHTFAMLILSVIIACFASSSYIWYLLACVPLIFARNYLNLFFQHLFGERKNDSLSEINYNIEIVSDLTVPLVFGILRDFIGFHAVVLFSLAPLILSVIILKRYSMPPSVENVSHEKDL